MKKQMLLGLCSCAFMPSLCLIDVTQVPHVEYLKQANIRQTVVVWIFSNAAITTFQRFDRLRARLRAEEALAKIR